MNYFVSFRRKYEWVPLNFVSFRRKYEWAPLNFVSFGVVVVVVVVGVSAVGKTIAAWLRLFGHSLTHRVIDAYVLAVAG